MEYIKPKSDFNLTAAKELINLSLYAPSVHCSYYACLQLLKFYVKKERGFSYQDIEDRCERYDGGTHNFIIDTCMNDVRMKTDSENHKWIKRSIKDLKEFRVNSDYFNIEITIDQGEKALSLSTGIITEIKKVLK